MLAEFMIPRMISHLLEDGLGLLGRYDPNDALVPMILSRFIPYVFSDNLTTILFPVKSINLVIKRMWLSHIYHYGLLKL